MKFIYKYKINTNTKGILAFTFLPFDFHKISAVQKPSSLSPALHDLVVCCGIHSASLTAYLFLHVWRLQCWVCLSTDGLSQTCICCYGMKKKIIHHTCVCPRIHYPLAGILGPLLKACKLQKAGKGKDQERKEKEQGVVKQECTPFMASVRLIFVKSKLMLVQHLHTTLWETGHSEPNLPHLTQNIFERNLLMRALYKRKAK